MFERFITYISDTGTPSFMPIVVFVLCICMGMKVGKALRSGLMIGAGFIGIGLLIEMMNSQLGPAAQAMSQRWGLQFQVIDIGWQGAAPMAWSSGLAMIAIPVAIGINVLMLLCKWTRTVNLDIWNIWHMIFTGAIAYAATGTLWIGIAGLVIHAVIVYKLGDLLAPFVEGYYELQGITVPHGTSAYMAPLACLVDWVIDRIPGINKIDFSMEKLQEKAGVFAEPVVMGGLMGSGIGILAGYGWNQVFLLGIEMAAVMVFMPQIVKCIMEGLIPLSERAKKMLSDHYGTGEFSIGLDPAVLLGDSQVVTAGVLFIPLTLVIAMLVPGNRVLPFGDLATISYFIAIAVAIHRGNLFRTLVSGSGILYMTIWITNQTIPWMTELGKITGTIDGNQAVAALDQGGSPITYLFVQLFVRENLIGWLVILVLYLVSVGIMITYSRWEKRKLQNE